MRKSDLPGMTKYGSLRKALAAISEQSKKHHEATIAKMTHAVPEAPKT